MVALRLVPVFLSAAIMAAHVAHATGNWVLSAVPLLLLLILLIRRRWSARVIQILLILGGIEMFRTMAALVSLYASIGKSPVLMVIIMAGASLFMAMCALLFESRTLRRMYL